MNDAYKPARKNNTALPSHSLFLCAADKSRGSARCFVNALVKLYERGSYRVAEIGQFYFFASAVKQCAPKRALKLFDPICE